MFRAITRTEAIAAINAKLSSLDDVRILIVADIVNEIAATEDKRGVVTSRSVASML
jgi:hypothetical protein